MVSVWVVWAAFYYLTYEGLKLHISYKLYMCRL